MDMLTNPARYAVVLNGTNLAPGWLDIPAHVILATSLSEVRDLLWRAKTYRNPMAVTADNQPTLDIPLYGQEGDYADVFRIEKPSRIPQLAFARMIHQYTERGVLQDLTPTYRFTYGPRGGINREEF